MTRQEFERRCCLIKKYWLDESFENRLKYVLDQNVIDFDSLHDDYSEVFPLVAAIIDRTVQQCLRYSFDRQRMKKDKKKFDNYKEIIR